MDKLAGVARFVGQTFGLWVIGLSAVAYVVPSIFVPIVPYIIWLLGLVMFGMGLTLSLRDFVEVARRPKEVALGIAAQFTVMPLVAFALTRLVPMSPEIAAGVVLVGSCPGGTASNVMTYLCRGDVALSVTLTTVSTLLAPFVTPFLVWLFASQYLPVDAMAMFASIAKVILLPLTIGIVVKALAPRVTQQMVPVLPLVSVATIVLIIAAIVAVNQPKLMQSGALIFAVVAVHNGFGMLLGYWAAKSMGLGVAQQRALLIEVGMQNSGLGAALAQAHFSPLSAVPSAVFSVWHNVSGAILASIYRQRPAPSVLEPAE